MLNIIGQKEQYLSDEEINQLFGLNSEIFAYKYAKSADWHRKYAKGHKDVKPYIHHKAGTWIKNIPFSKHGLFFFTDLKYLVPYSTYGDLLIKIKIRKNDVQKMKIKKVHGGIPTEYSCKTYFVEEILPVNDERTIKFIMQNADNNFPFTAEDIDSLFNRLKKSTNK